MSGQHGGEVELACRLGDAELRRRLAWIRREVIDRAERVERLPGGIRISVTGAEPVALLMELMTLERACCPFLGFTLMVPPAGSATLHVTAPEAARAQLDDWLAP